MIERSAPVGVYTFMDRVWSEVEVCAHSCVCVVNVSLYALITSL